MRQECRWVLWEVILGRTSEDQGECDREGGYTAKDKVLFRRLPLWATGT